jgi:hypothetical protein
MITKFIRCKCFPSEEVGNCSHYELCRDALNNLGEPGYEKELPLDVASSPKRT